MGSGCWTGDTDALIDDDWLGAKLKAALDLRATDPLTRPFYRLVHAEGDGLPGLIVDRFGDTLVMQPNAVWLEERLDSLAALLQATDRGHMHRQERHLARPAPPEGLAEEMAILLGDAPEGPLDVPMNGARLQGGRDGRAEDGAVLRPAAPTTPSPRGLRRARACSTCSPMWGGFALACLAHGAASALAVDASTPALELAREGAEASGVADQFRGTRARRRVRTRWPRWRRRVRASTS